jgi:hypothetical protein
MQALSDCAIASSGFFYGRIKEFWKSVVNLTKGKPLDGVVVESIEKITNGKPVGGKNAEIALYSDAVTGGTCAMVKKVVNLMKGKS